MIAINLAPSVCSRCRKPNYDHANHRYCRDCYNEWRRDNRAGKDTRLLNRRRDGICVVCRKNPTNKNNGMCNPCNAAYQRERRATIIAERPFIRNVELDANNANGLVQRRKCRDFINSLKVSGCIRCGYKKCMSALDFHHRDPNSKLFDISVALKQGHTVEEVINEVKKCDILCRNCHMEVHEEMKQNKLTSLGVIHHE